MIKIYLKPDGDNNNDMYYETDKYESAGGVSFTPLKFMCWKNNKIVDVLEKGIKRIFVPYSNVKQVVHMEEIK